jgi:hypothetical protein
MGRPKGSKNNPKLRLEIQEISPGKRPTPAQRMQALKRQVALYVADGMVESSIAAVMEMPVEKLRAVFRRELLHGREIVRANELRNLDAASAAGSVPASKALLAAANGDPNIPARKEKGVAGLNEAALRIINGGKRD